MIDYYEELKKIKEEIDLEELLDESNLASPYIEELKKNLVVFEEISDAAKKFNLALTYAKQGSEDLAMIQIKKVLSMNPRYVPGHLLCALLYMKAENNTEAKKEVEEALAIDPYNTTAKMYLGELTGTFFRKPNKPAVEVISEEKYKIPEVGHYEDPDSVRWKQIIYLLAGIGLGILAMFVLVVPSVRSGANVDYNALKKEYEQTVQIKESKIAELESSIESYEIKNEELNKQLSVYEGEDGEDSMYDSVLKAYESYSGDDYVTSIEYLEKVEQDVLPSDTAKRLYNTMMKDVYTKAASQLSSEGQELYEAYNYESALAKFKKSYEYKESYNTKYYLAMCYKRTGDTDTANKYFYDIINNSGDSDLIVQAANNGLELTVNDARVAAGQDPVEVYGYDPEAEDESSGESDDSYYNEE